MSSLRSRGYSYRGFQIPQYDHQKRIDFLCKIWSRDSVVSCDPGDHSVKHFPSTVTCVVDFTAGVSSLRMQRRLDDLKVKLQVHGTWADDISFRVAYASERNMFLRTYQLNFSAGSRVG